MATEFKALDINTAYKKYEGPSAPDSNPPSKANVSASIAAVGFIAVLIVAPTFGDWCTLAPDSFDYLTTARTLHETGRYPDYYMMRPPGFPTIIAPLFYFGDPPLLAIRMLLAVCFVATGALTTALLFKPFGRSAAVVAGLLTVTNAVLLRQTTVALTEAVFIPIQLAALLFIERSRRAPSIRRAMLAGALTACAIMVRTVGAALLPVGIVAILFRPKCAWRVRLMEAATFAVLAASMPYLWHIRQAPYPAQTGYGRMWTQSMEAEQTDAAGIALQFERFRKFGAERLIDIKRALIPNRVGWRAFRSSWSPIATAAIALLAIGACLFRILRSRSAADAYALLVLLVVALWPWDEGVRLVAPLIPIFYGSLVALSVVALKRASRYRSLAATVLLAATFSLHAWEAIESYGRMEKEREKSERRLATAKSFAETIRKVVPPDAQLLCVTRNESNAKLTFAGGVYFSRRGSIRYLDIVDNQNTDLGVFGDFYAAVEIHLAEWMTQAGLGAPVHRTAEFEIFRGNR